MKSEVLEAARRAYALGLCVVPPREDGSKRPVGDTWKQWQTDRPDRQQMNTWFSNGKRYGVGLMPGPISNGLTAFEFDSYETYEAFLQAAKEIAFDWLIEKIRTGYEERTPGGGIHWLYYCEDVQGNTELAKRPKAEEEKRHPKDNYQMLIETRGEGGYIVIAPSHGPVHPSGGAYELLQGSLETIATIEPEEQKWLFKLAEVFDEVPKTEYPEPRQPTEYSGKRPGDEFNESGPSWSELLEDHGWARVFTRGQTEYWRRPGKDDGISATINGPGVSPDRLYVFTTSTVFEANKSYSRFQAYTFLEHGGDFNEAARQLASQGYGDPPLMTTLTILPTPTREKTDTTSWPKSPPLNGPVFHGLAGDIVRTIEPETEADPMGMLLTLLAAFGNIAGIEPHWKVGARPHRMLLYPVLVGPTSKGRKGTTWGAIQPVLKAAVPEWVDRNVVSGLSSGEGLIWAVRDPIYKQEPIKEKGVITGYQDVMIDSGVNDKRLFVIEEEFASTIKVMRRESNILSAVIRQAWDDGNLRTLTKNSPARSTGAHISILGHITQDELVRYLEDTETGNGFANRFLWVAVRRSKALPGGGDLSQDDIEEMGDELTAAIQRAKHIRLMERDARANELWYEIYEDLSEGGFGLMGAVTSRAEAQVMRLASVYAAIDGSSQITDAHLSAALGIWDYCEASALYVFGDSLGDPVADGVLQIIRSTDRESGISQSDISNALGRNVPASKLERALTQLQQAGKVIRESKSTGGRPATVWRAA